MRNWVVSKLLGKEKFKFGFGELIRLFSFIGFEFVFWLVDIFGDSCFSNMFMLAPPGSILKFSPTETVGACVHCLTCALYLLISSGFTDCINKLFSGFAFNIAAVFLVCSLAFGFGLVMVFGFPRFILLIVSSFLGKSLTLLRASLSLEVYRFDASIWEEILFSLLTYVLLVKMAPPPDWCTTLVWMGLSVSSRDQEAVCMLLLNCLAWLCAWVAYDYFISSTLWNIRMFLDFEHYVVVYFCLRFCGFLFENPCPWETRISDCNSFGLWYAVLGLNC